MARRPIRGTATKQDTGKTCPFCRFPVKERDEVVSCGECHSSHHEDCWEDHGGCAVPGCAGGPRTEPDAGDSSSGGTHVPPKAGPSAKKVTLDPEPAPRQKRRKREKAQPRATASAPPSEAKGGPSKLQFWVAGAAVAFLAILGVIVLSNNFGDTDPASAVACESGTGENGVPCYDNGILPNIPNNEMRRQATAFIREWYGDLNHLDWGTAWRKLTPRVKEQINQRGGFNTWKKKQGKFSKYLNPRQATVTIVKPSYGDEGVLSVDVQNMPYNDQRDLCQERVGVTWIKWDPEAERWLYEPGLDVTDQRAKDWGYQSSRLLKYTCS
jgi:hypothetical protein